VKGIIQLETGCIGNRTRAEITTIPHIPILIQNSDFSPVPAASGACPTMISRITAARGDIKFAWIPVPLSWFPGAITGNDHTIIVDDNNLEIADIFIGWATPRNLNRISPRNAQSAYLRTRRHVRSWGEEHRRF
jgi:hypothetical protein